MATVAQKLQKLLEIKEAIRQAIIGKGQNVASTLPFSSYPAKIAAIQTGMDTSDATAGAGDILSGKTAYAKGSKITGTIASKGAANLTASGASVTVPAGYYPSQVSKSVSTATQATPSITVDSAGKITASATQSAGYVSAGTKSATKQLTTQAAKTITPGASSQTAVASGRYTTGAVTVAGDTNLKAENIAGGVSIFEVEGSLIKAGQTITLGYVNNAFVIKGEYLTVGANTWTPFKMLSPITLENVVCLRIAKVVNGEYVYTGTVGFFVEVGTVVYDVGDVYEVYVPRTVFNDNRAISIDFEQ